MSLTQSMTSKYLTSTSWIADQLQEWNTKPLCEEPGVRSCSTPLVVVSPPFPSMYLQWKQPCSYPLTLLPQTVSISSGEGSYEGFPGGAGGKESACYCGRCERCTFKPRVRKIPQRRKQYPTPVFLPGKFHGQKGLAGSSSWGHEESDTMVD